MNVDNLIPLPAPLFTYGVRHSFIFFFWYSKSLTPHSSAAAILFCSVHFLHRVLSIAHRYLPAPYALPSSSLYSSLTLQKPPHTPSSSVSPLYPYRHRTSWNPLLSLALRQNVPSHLIVYQFPLLTITKNIEWHYLNGRKIFPRSFYLVGLFKNRIPHRDRLCNRCCHKSVILDET
jgi:hypothetical protein